MSGIADRRRVMSKTILYETLTVTVSGLSSGFTIYVINATTGATIDATNSTSSTYEIEEGTKYYVSASSVSGYDKPANSSTYTAVGNNSRTIRMTYSVSHSGTKNPGNGIWISDADGYYHKDSSWTGKYTFNGIAVVTSTCSFIISPYEAMVTDYPWNTYHMDYNYEKVLSKQYLDSDSASKDYNGFDNTSEILAFNSNYKAAKYCSNYTFPYGNKGYLGSAGEFAIVNSNLSLINSAAEYAGYTNAANNNCFMPDRGYPMWTSTECTEDCAWQWGGWNYFDDYQLGMDAKNAESYVRPFSKLI